MRFRTLLRLTACLILLEALLPRPAHAYLDPGVGSLVVQAGIAAAVAGAYAVRQFWGSIVGLFTRQGRRSSTKDKAPRH